MKKAFLAILAVLLFVLCFFQPFSNSLRINQISSFLPQEKRPRFVSCVEYHPWIAFNNGFGFIENFSFDETLTDWGVRNLDKRLLDICSKEAYWSIKDNDRVLFYIETFNTSKSENCACYVLSQCGQTLPDINTDRINEIDLSTSTFWKQVNWDKDGKVLMEYNDDIQLELSSDLLASFTDVMEETLSYQMDSVNDDQSNLLSEKECRFVQRYYLKIFFEGWPNLYYNPEAVFLGKTQSGEWVLVATSIEIGTETTLYKTFSLPDELQMKIEQLVTQ